MVKSNGGLVNAKRSVFSVSLEKLGSNWLLVDCLDNCTEDVCFG